MPAHPGSDSSREAVFGERLDLAEAFASLLATVGVERGLIGPREADRIWDRHLLNCAVIADLLPADARVVDVGSGAGLPGLAIAIRRRDVAVDLVESLQRRTDFLTEAVEHLGLSNQVRVVRGRAEDGAVRDTVGQAHWVTARAVAPLDRLVRWCLPLLAGGGRLLAIKGDRGRDELKEFAATIRRLGGVDPEVVTRGVGLVESPTTVVVVRRKATMGRSTGKATR